MDERQSAGWTLAEKDVQGCAATCRPLPEGSATGRQRHGRDRDHATDTGGNAALNLSAGVEAIGLLKRFVPGSRSEAD
jgi:hypothetical protein